MSERAVTQDDVYNLMDHIDRMRTTLNDTTSHFSKSADPVLYAYHKGLVVGMDIVIGEIAYYLKCSESTED